ncbi:6-phosphogluconolactonase [Arundinibacter roseus]|uniref:Glucosamine-6-phosphate deaminase n=1 Tax=Arundinibacter roseus TaxID=2070510 RepID=A0A4R4KIJ7_9BACT|nr:glucosamine-6-phosphate deaminase [Arundinibacter roseus]TDB68030.1 glucosamine-6-phosphate deaminase [Arundinibacter roseus]
MVQIYPTYDELSLAAAGQVAQLLHQKPEAVLCLPSGSTPQGMFKILADWSKAGTVDFSRCTFVGLDEWVGLGPDDEGSCRYWLDRDFLHPVGFRAEQIIYFDAKSADLQGQCNWVNQKIAELGGLDLMVLGVGMNGHLALNEPGTSFGCYAHLSELAPITVEVGQKYFAKQTPLTRGITLGLRHAREAKKLLILASGAAKAEVMRQALTGPVTEEFPVSLVQTDEQILVMLDADAASELDR